MIFNLVRNTEKLAKINTINNSKVNCVNPCK